jgi:hypothetical protein
MRYFLVIKSSKDQYRLLENNPEKIKGAGYLELERIVARIFGFAKEKWGGT